MQGPSTSARQACRIPSRPRAALLAAALVLAAASGAFAQAVPQVTISGLDASPLIGQPLSFTVSFDNASPAQPGFGPFIDVILPANGADGAGVSTAENDGVSFVSASYLGQPVTAVAITFNASGQATHPYAVNAAGVPLVVTGPPGDQLVVLQLPFGSFTADQPPAPVVVNTTLSNRADAGFALAIQARGGFQFGNDALNNPATDPSIVGGFVSQTVSPTVLRLSKAYLGPEDETATGPNYPRRYRITVDVATGQTVTNLDVTDLLPANLQFLAVTDASAVGSPAVSSIATPSTTTPGGTLTRRFSSVTGTAGSADATLEFSFYVPRIDAGGAEIISPVTGDDATSRNQAAATGTWTPIDTRDTPGPVSAAGLADPPEYVIAPKSIAIQKGVAVAVDTGNPGPSPGDTLEYTLQIQVSDYFAFHNVIVTDVFSDGQRWNAAMPTLAVSEHSGQASAAAPFNPANVSFVVDSPGTGTTTATFAISAELVARLLDGRLVGGCVPQSGTGGPPPDCTAFNGGATTVTITFRTVIQEDFSDTFPSGDSSVDQGDVLDNAATVRGSVLQVADAFTPTGSDEDDGTGASVRIPDGALSKSIFAINGNTGFTDARLGPGDTVTYRLRYALPTSDIEPLTLTDFLPLPVLFASEVTARDTSGAVTPPAGQWKFGPADTFAALSGLVPALGVDTVSNSVRFSWPAFDTPASTPSEIDLLFTVTASNQPFADGLFLTNQVRASVGSTNAGSQVADSIVQIQLNEPNLRIRKGVIASSNAAGTFSPATRGPVTFNAPGTPTVRWSGTIHSNGLATSPINSNLTNVDAGDLVTFAIVVENIGSGPDGAFDVRVRDTLPAGYAVPPGGLNLQVRNGAGVALPFTTLGGGLFDAAGGIELTDPGVDQGALTVFGATSGTNVLVVTYDVQLVATVQPNQLFTNTAALTNYAGTEGGPDFTAQDPTDVATVRVALPSATKTILGTNQAHTSGNFVTIGELVQYQVVVRVPEGQSLATTLTDVLDAGLVFVSLDSLTASPALSASAGSFADILGAAVISASGTGPTAAGRQVQLSFGTLTNADTDNATNETITLRYTVAVLNASTVIRSALLNNAVTWAYTGGGNVSASAPNVTVVEPTLVVQKTANPVSGDAGDTVTFTVTLSNPAGTNRSDAFDVVLADPLPAGLSLVSAVHTGGVAPTTGPTVAGNGFSATFDRLNVGQTSTFTVTATVDLGLSTGAVLTNVASSTWTSLPGDVTTPQSPHNGLSTERTGNPANPGGAANSYLASAPSPFTVISASVAKVVVETNQPFTAGLDAAVGEILTYRLQVSLPEAVSSNVTLVDTLDAGLAFVGFDSLEVSNPAAVTTSVPGGFPAVLANVVVSNPGGSDPVTAGSRATFNFGTITNTDTNGSVAETITIVYRAVVLNSAANLRGQPRNNSAAWTAGGSSVTTSAPDVTIVEPQLAITKTIAPSAADADDAVTVTLVVSHAGTSNADAFDVELADVLPAGLVFAGTLQHTAGLVPGVLTEAGGTVTARWASFPLGATSTIAFTARIAVTATPGTLIQNTGRIAWTSLPGAVTTPQSSFNGLSTERTGNVADLGGAVNTYQATNTASVAVHTNSIAGFVYLDRNDDGIYQSGGPDPEPPLAGVVLTLTGTDHLGNAVQLTTTTLADGSYSFPDLRPGTYALAQVQPVGYADGKDTPGTPFGGAAGTLANDVISGITIPRGGSVAGTDYNFGERETADVAVTKEGPVAVLPGATVFYTITVTNAGPTVARDVRLTDPLPAGTTFASLPLVPLGWTCTPPAVGSTGDLVCTIPTLGVSASPQFIVAVTVDPALVTGARLTNVVAVGASTLDPDPENNRDQVTSVVGSAQTADLGVVKTDAADPVQTGGTVSYTVVVTNHGPGPATGVEVADQLPASLTLLSATPSQGGPCSGTSAITCPLGSLAAGSTASISILATATAPGVVVNSVTVTANEPDPNPDNNADTEPTTVGNPTDADLLVRKTASAASVVPGQPLRYVIAVENRGPGVALGAEMTDVLPPSLTLLSLDGPPDWGCSYDDSNRTATCSNPVFPVGTASFEILAWVDPAVAPGTALTNTASTAATTPDPDPSNNTARVTTPVVAATDADLEIVKTDAPDVAVAGTAVSYTLSVTNRGPATATNVTVTDTLPAGTSFVSGSPGCTDAGGTISCNVGTLAPGSVVAVGITITTPPVPGVIDNAATVSGDQPDPVPANNADEEPTTLVARADVRIVKTGPFSATAGSTVSYTLLVDNVGPSIAEDVTVADATPPGLAWVSTSGDCTTAFPCALGSLAPGATRSIVVTFAVPTGYVAPDPIENTATVATTTVDLDPTNDVATAVTPLFVDADVRLAKAGPASIVAGQSITYTLTIVNDGPSDATGVSVADPTPAGLVFVSNAGSCTTAFPCALGTLLPGATRTITSTYLVPPGYMAPDPIVNTATVTAVSGDANPGNNTASAVTVLGPPSADLAVTKVGPPTVVPGNTVTYTITVTNAGPSSASEVSLADPTPAGLSWVSTTGACTTALPCALGTIDPGDVRVVTVTFLVPGGYQLPDPIVNTATVTSTTSDPVLANNTATAETGVGADLVLAKTASPSPAVAGGEIEYQLVSTNLGGRIAENLTIIDSVPAGTTFLSATMSDGQVCQVLPAVGGSGTIRCTWPGQTLAGGVRTLTVRVAVDPNLAAGSTVVNMASTSSDVNDPNPANNVASTTTPVTQAADIAVQKAVNDPAPRNGDLVTFTVVASNLGPSNATGVALVDVLPAGLTFVDALPGAGTFDPATGRWALGALPVGASASLQLRARVETAGPLVNVATKVAGDQPDPDTSNDASSASLNAAPVADVRVRKTVDQPQPALGELITFTVEVTNAGPNAATGVVVSDPLPAGLALVSAETSRGTYEGGSGRWDVGALGVADLVTLTLRARTTTTEPVVNTARKVAQVEVDPLPANDASGVVVDGRAADLQVVKSVDDPMPRPGATVRFTVHVTNNGPDAVSDVVIREVLPPGLALVSAVASQGAYVGSSGTWFVGALDAAGAGATAVLSIEATVTGTGTLRNQAVVTGSSLPDPNPMNDGSAVDVRVDADPIDLTILINRVGDACEIGALVDHYLSVTNVGPGTTRGPILVSLELPQGLRFVTANDGWACGVAGPTITCRNDGLALGDHVTATLRVTSTADQNPGVPQWAHASVAHAEDGNPSNNVDRLQVCGEPVFRVPIDPADLAVAQGDATAAAGVGDVFDLTTTVTNRGPDPSPTTTVTALVPAGLELMGASAHGGSCSVTATPACVLGSLGVDQSAVVRWVFRVIGAGIFQFNVSALGTEFDPDVTNNAAVTSVTASASRPAGGDADGDGLPDAWEVLFGLNPAVDDAGADPDGDGLTNRQEFDAGSHPRGFHVRYFAEGVVNGTFSTTFAVANPSAHAAAAVLVRAQDAQGRTATAARTVGRNQHVSVAAGDFTPPLAGAFSAIVESDLPVAAERTVSWDDRRYGAHAEAGQTAPATRWYFAEGATHSGFNVFYLVQNPGPVPADVTITFLPAAATAPIEHHLQVQPGRRATVWMNTVAGLEAAEAAAIVASTNGVPIVAERAMYLDTPGLAMGAGHAAAGVPAPATAWQFAEGATGPLFDTFLLLAVPGAQAAEVAADYLLPDGSTVTRHHRVGARSRLTIWVDHEADALAATSFGVTLRSTNGVPFVAERAMWWPGTGAGQWQEAHASAGLPAPAGRWVVADGEVGGSASAMTYLLVANAGARAGTVRVRLLMDDGSAPERTFPLAGSGRLTIDVGAAFPEARGRRFGALVESLDPADVRIVVERASYWDAAGGWWAAGTSAPATPLPD